MDSSIASFSRYNTSDRNGRGGSQSDFNAFGGRAKSCGFNANSGSCVLLFLCRDVLSVDLPQLEKSTPAKKI